ncbi:hypothetical protein [Streptomyces sp. OK228]|uniref:hypothetical protein n=1 Tax=Streptomyces sp. OK228 TaxID=1882786 RepID=UPI000BD723CB|nr:hypothetical protein [Streptomyces sp. OK228]SOE32585.1 hypothetical protein SAMN05442782_9551 [Streptomyces sp. OK228]
MTDLQDLTEDELLAQLDVLLFGSDEYISGRELRVAIERSRNWLSVWLAENRDKICREIGNQGLNDPGAQEGFIEVATVAEIIMHTGLDPYCSPLVAAILLKRGIQLLCQ